MADSAAYRVVLRLVHLPRTIAQFDELFGYSNAVVTTSHVASRAPAEVQEREGGIRGRRMKKYDLVRITGNKNVQPKNVTPAPCSRRSDDSRISSFDEEGNVCADDAPIAVGPHPSLAINLQVGDVLVSRYRNPMFEIVEDSCGRHDITFPPCDPVVYERRFGKRNHRSCRTNLAEVMEGEGIPYAHLPEPVNFFQNTPVMPDGRIEDHTSSARPGDRVVLRALMDVVVAGSACPMEGGVNGDRLTDIRFVVRNS